MDPAIVENLLKAIQDALSDRRRGDDVVLPPFDPEKNENGAASWCRSINSIAVDMGWSNITTVAKAGKALKGSALLWYETWDPEEGRSWEEFRTTLTDLYPEKRNLSEKLSKAVLLTSENSDSYCEYAREKIRLFKQTKIAFTEEQLVELICGGIHDATVKMAAHNSRVDTTAKLISLFTTYVKAQKKRPLDSGNKTDKADKNDCSTTSSFPPKRPKFENIQDRRCFICNKPGHTRAQCFKNPNREASEPAPKASTSSSTIQTRPVQCTYCKKVGHTEDVCFFKQRNNNLTKNVTSNDNK